MLSMKNPFQDARFLSPKTPLVYRLTPKSIFLNDNKNFELGLLCGFFKSNAQFIDCFMEFIERN